MKKSVLVSLSGGVDSAMTAWMLLQQGYSVTGVHFRFSEIPSDHNSSRLELLSDTLGIPIIRYDARELFAKKVVSYMTQMHIEGRTPSPCTRCNPEVKWKLMEKLKSEKKTDYFASGHYVRINREDDQIHILKGKDLKKDQSYYLWDLKSSQLRYAMCPMGDFQKDEIKKLATENGFDFLVREKESTGMCFANSRSYAELLEANLDDRATKKGDVIDRSGRKIGTHKGYIFYTIGQKKDLQLSVDKRDFCVAEIHPEGNLLVADSWESLYRDEFIIGQTHFFNSTELFSGIPVQTLVRGFGRNPEGNTRITKIRKNYYHVKLENPAWAVAPGQPAVFYSGDKLIGGGIVIE